MDKIQEFRKIVGEMADTYEKKNENYGDSFGQLCEDLGPIAGLVPLYNKIHRATSLVKSGKNHFESLEDTFIDLACYAIMNVIEMRIKRKEECSDNREYLNKEHKSNDIFKDAIEYNPQEYIINDHYSPYVVPYKPQDYGITTLEYNNPCKECGRRYVINGCDGCSHNVILTNNCNCTNGGTK